MIAASVLLWRNRSAVADRNRFAQERAFGAASSRTGRASTAETMGRVAIGWGAIGALGMVLSLFDLNWGH
ncbi:hypothetical protein ACVW07_002052 [Cellulomonas sp. URHB0016]